MTAEEFWTSWWAFWIVGGGPFLLAVVSFAYSLYLRVCHLDAMKEALKNSRYIYIWGPSLGCRGLIWSLLEIVKITGMISMPKTHIRLGDLAPVDAENFPPRLKFLLKIKAVIIIGGGIWWAVVFVLLQFRCSGMKIRHMEEAFGIFSRSMLQHWDKAGGPGQIPGYAAHVEAVSRATKYMKAGGYIGIGLGGMSSLLAIQQVCNGDSGAACEKIKFTEAGKFGLSTALGAFSGWAAGAASAPVCLGIGVATGGIGGVVCVAALVGAGAWAGTTAGGMGGEYIGEMIYEATQP
ncbi:hypothetical protein C4J95_2220 [Pseudomonas orientalis]|uniref:hypothetical protein n=1 Tax=Pseudomonas orientalis TaxID=76758 RepID=UPI000F6EAA46|nr:hypothetical protein [Pseudomonas orientalis]AZE99682.1 hypothetical protein C4J95_2220 [Pseudomonas orientalis]